MTTYNSGKYLKESINSILNQDYKDFELIIVDDFSEDNTMNIIESINDKRIKLFKNSKKGRGNALNFGLNVSNSKYIALNDSDDISVPFRLSTQQNYLKNKPDNFVVSTNFACFRNNKLLYEIQNPEHSKDIKKSLAKHCRIMNSGVMYNREHILKSGGYENVLAEDYMLWLKIMNDTEFYNIQNVLMFVRLDENSLSVVNQKNFKEKNKAVYDIQGKSIDYSVESKNSSEKELNILKGWREYFYGTPQNARKYWQKIGFKIFNLKILFAYVLTYFPESFVVKFKSFMLRYRIEYYLKYFSQKNSTLRKLFKQTLNSVR
ncbi:MAG TPA: glycosyltransferase family A protein [Ignavibacteria bacterium]|nr:glycosyltransferase family A protein [Ignavibacteria bacterium]